MPIEWHEHWNGWDQHYRLEDDGTFHRRTTMDAEPVVEAAKAAHNDGAGSSKDGSLKHVASIPLALYLQWKDAGVDILKGEGTGFLRRKLDDPELAHLRIWKGRLGKHHE